MSTDTSQFAQSQQLHPRIKVNWAVGYSCITQEDPFFCGRGCAVRRRKSLLTEPVLSDHIATQKNTISELRILSEDKKDNDQDENEGDVAKDPNLMSAQTAGETGGITGEVNKGKCFPSLVWSLR